MWLSGRENGKWSGTAEELMPLSLLDIETRAFLFCEQNSFCFMGKLIEQIVLTRTASVIKPTISDAEQSAIKWFCQESCLYTLNRSRD